MKLLSEKTTLVIAGAWNPAIITPQWIGKNILNIPEGTSFQVGMDLPIQGLGGSPRFTFSDLSYTPTPDTLTFYFSPEHPAKTIEVARTILETLPHTPIVALGINFSFSVDPGSGELKNSTAWSAAICDLLTDDDSAKIVTQSWQLGLKTLNHLMNVIYQSSAEAATISVNHHYETEGTADRAAQILRQENLYTTLLNLTQSFVEGLVKPEIA